MNCNLQCSFCGVIREVHDLNLCRVVAPCAKCGRLNSISQMLRNVYGERAGKESHAIIGKLERDTEHSKDPLGVLAKAERAVERLIAV